MTTSSERAYVAIKSEILRGRYPAGHRMIEETIANELAISRTPVRDAIRRLHSDGLVEFTPNAGARIPSWSERELAEITQMRALLESFAAELAAAKITQQEVEALVGLADEMDAALDHPDGPDLERLSNANLAFHRLIVSAAGNSRLALTLESLWALPLLIRKFGLFNLERLKRSGAHHRELIAALQVHDAQWAAAIMRTHILAAQSYDQMLSSRSAD